MTIEGTIIENFERTVKKYPHKKALMYKEKGIYHSISFDDFFRRVKIAARALQELGIGKGDRVAILSNNRPEWAITDLATMMIGAISVPIHMNLSAKIIHYILNHCGAKAIVVSSEEQLNKISQAELNSLGNFIFLGEITDEIKGSKDSIISWNEFMARGGSGLDQDFALDIKEDDVCTIIYTSGTTGLPKGVELTHKNFVSDVLMTNLAIPALSTDVFLSFLPLSHVLERTGGYYMALCAGATIAYAENIKSLAKNLKEVRPTILICVPRIFEKFYEVIWDKTKKKKLQRIIFHWALKQKTGTIGKLLADIMVFAKVRKSFGGRLRLTISGGACLNEKMAKFFHKMGILILEGYGLTETSPVVAVNREANYKFGTVGLPLEGVQIKMTSDKEILIKGDNVMKSYYQNPQETADSIDGDGWLHTGDFGFIDSDGFLIVIGRKKEMIVTSGGKNIWPEHIELELNYDRFIAQSIIIGHNQKFISALIVPHRKELSDYLKEKGMDKYDLADPLVQQIYNRCIDKVNSNLSDYEQIKKFVLLPREFSQELDELTPTLKIRRNAIEHHFEEVINKIYN